MTGGGSLGNPGPSWHLKATGDFYGNGSPDLVWQNDDGTAYVWETNGSSAIGGGSLGNPGPSWHIVGSGDFNDDGKSDILWQNDSGEAYIWELNGAMVIGGGSRAIPALLGAPSELGISTTTALPTSFGRTTAARSTSGR